MVIYQGKIATSSRVFYGQVEINTKTGLIERVVPLSNKITDRPDRVFGKDCIMYPGMSDIHIHSRQDETGDHDYKETYKTAANAAMNGGVVCILPMPNQKEPVINAERLRWHEDKIRELKHAVAILNYVGIGPGTRPIEGRRVPYKAYTGPSVGDLFFEGAKQLRETLQHYVGKDISFHVEDDKVLKESARGNNHSKRRPIKCVETALRYVLKQIEDYKINAKLCHWSTGNHSFEMIEEHRDKMEGFGLGYNTTIEVSPLHLLFDSDMLEAHPELWPRVQMNPAIQSREHRMQLIQGLKDGFIDYFATDHAPHTLDEKFKVFKVETLKQMEGNKSFTSLASGQVKRLKEYIKGHSKLSPEGVYLSLIADDLKLCQTACCEDGMSGAPWLDTFALVTTRLVAEHNFTHEDIARVASGNPGLFVNQFLDKDQYGKGFGRIETGYQGSLTVINFKKPTTVKRENLQTKCGWSPLEGKEFSGSLEAVIIRGEDWTGRFAA